MKKDWKYIIYLSIIIGIFVTVKLMAPRQYDWRVTLAHDDKNPFGSFALNELLPTLFQDKPIKNSYQTLYELNDSIHQHDNIFILTSSFSPGKEDTEVLLWHVARGATAFISADYFYGKFADTLGLAARDYFFKSGDLFADRDTAKIHLTNPKLDTARQYSFRRDNVHNYFYKVDSTSATVIAKNDMGKPVTLLADWGKGKFVLNCTPLAFTNIHLLSGSNHQFISSTFSYLPNEKVWWTEFYHLGRMEASTPLRFILTNEPLSWAYYISIISVLMFMVFEAKRKQRVIPIIRPLSNTTLEFVSTIGNLYHQRSDHKNIAEKKILFFFDQVRSRFYLNTNKRDEYFIHALSRKSEHAEEKVRNFMLLINNILSRTEIESNELMDLSKRIEDFWRK